jgi:predicted RNA methylase
MLDPEGVHLAALRRPGDFSGRRALELGCGDGRLKVGIARDAKHVLAFDPDAVKRARRSLPEEPRETRPLASSSVDRTSRAKPGGRRTRPARSQGDA